MVQPIKSTGIINIRFAHGTAFLEGIFYGPRIHFKVTFAMEYVPARIEIRKCRFYHAVGEEFFFFFFKLFQAYGADPSSPVQRHYDGVGNIFIPAELLYKFEAWLEGKK